MELIASPEPIVDYEQAARIANAAFASPDVVVDPAYLRWLYETCFRAGSTVIALRHEGRKVGHFAMIRQTLSLNGVEESAAQLVDLCILKEFRGKKSLIALYDGVEQAFKNEGIRFAIGMPNRKAAPINEHFFALKPFLTLPIFAGLPRLLPPRVRPTSLRFAAEDKAAMLAIFAPFCGNRAINGLVWQKEALFARLTGPKYHYGLHFTNDALVISSLRLFKGVRYALICGILTRDAVLAGNDRSLQALTWSACAMWGAPLFVYAGVNASVAAYPGFAVPDKLRPSPMLVQVRDFRPDLPGLTLDRYQLIDFDFA